VNIIYANFAMVAFMRHRRRKVDACVMKVNSLCNIAYVKYSLLTSTF